MIKRKIIRLFALILVFNLLLASISCSQSSQRISSTASNPVPADAVVIGGSSFSPANIIIAAGTSVTWTNRDKVSYRIVDNEQTFAFDLSAQGSFRLTFPKTGVFNYHCLDCPEMQGTITVVNGANCRSLAVAINKAI